MRKPWAKFYFQDWRGDPRLRICTLSARGLWIEILAIADQADPRGHLLIEGRAPTDTQLAMLAGAPPDQIPSLLDELGSAGVFSKTRKGVIYSRRMVNDEKKSKTARKNGQQGGNPSLCNDAIIYPLDNQEDKPPDKGVVKTQRPETRDQRKASSAFEEFWEAFSDKRGKEPAQRAWKAIRGYDAGLHAEITAGAGRYAAARPGLLANGGMPKMAQGWLTDRRWEDAEAPQKTESQYQEFQPRKQA